MKNAEQILEEVKANGQVEIRNGVYLMSQEFAIEDQKAWDDEDPQKDLDLTSSDFWIITNDGNVVGLDTAEVLEQINP